MSIVMVTAMAMVIVMVMEMISVRVMLMMNVRVLQASNQQLVLLQPDARRDPSDKIVEKRLGLHRVVVQRHKVVH